MEADALLEASGTSRFGKHAAALVFVALDLASSACRPELEAVINVIKTGGHVSILAVVYLREVRSLLIFDEVKSKDNVVAQKMPIFARRGSSKFSERLSITWQ